MHRLLERQLKKSGGSAAQPPADWPRFIAMISDAYDANDTDRAMIEHSMELSSRELFERNQKLAQAELKYRSIFEHATEGIFQISPEGRFISANSALAAILGYDSPMALMLHVARVGEQLFVSPQRWKQLVAELQDHAAISQFEAQVRRQNGDIIWISETCHAARDPQGAITHIEGTLHDVSKRRRAEEERAELQARLISLSRSAGMAEIATSVLHNVGNVLNSVNVSLNIASAKVQQSPIQNLGKAVAMMTDHAHDLGDFLSRHEKGKHILQYLVAATGIMDTERTALLEEMTSLAKNIDHIKQIVAVQQTHAKSTSILEEVNVAGLVEDALQVNALADTHSTLEIIREYAPIPPLLIDRHAVLQILINLISNAKHAVTESANPRRRITLGLLVKESAAQQSLLIQVADNGVGIDPANLTRIFNHGFTTRKDGHGFGLHSAANAAQSLGGSLSAQSPGPGQGATFTLELPARQERSTQ